MPRPKPVGPCAVHVTSSAATAPAVGGTELQRGHLPLALCGAAPKATRLGQLHPKPVLYGGVHGCCLLRPPPP